MAQYIANCSGELKTADDVRMFLHKHDIAGAAQLSDRKLYSVKRFLDEMLLEDFHESFSFLQSQVGILLEANPGSIAEIQSIQIPDSEGICKTERFYRMFFVLGSDIEMAKRCKPIVSFDAGGLKLGVWSNYQVMVCGMQDGEGRDCSVGFAVVPAEDEQNYTFFIEGLKSNLDLKAMFEEAGLLVISDRSKGLASAVKNGLPRAHHRWCNLHLLGNLPAPGLSDAELSLYWRIVKSSTESEFEEHMAYLRSSRVDAYRYLRKQPPAYWTTWASPLPTWGLTTNNLSERAVLYMGSDRDLGRKSTMLAMIVKYTKKVREYSLQTNQYINDTMTEQQQKRCETRFRVDSARSAAGHVISSEAHNRFQESLKEAHRLQSKLVGKVRSNDETEYHVWFPHTKQLSASGYRASLSHSITEDRQTVFVGKDGSYTHCSCARFSGGNVLFPCKHSLVVLLNMQRVGDILKNADKYFHSCFLMSNVLQASSHAIQSAFHVLPRRSDLLLLGPPPSIVSKVATGQRIQSRSQLHSRSSGGKKLRRCSACGEAGHTVRRCPAKDVPVSERKQFIEDRRQEAQCREHQSLQQLDVNAALSTVTTLPFIYPTALTVMENATKKRRRLETESDEDNSDEIDSSEDDCSEADEYCTDIPSAIAGLVRSLLGSSWQDHTEMT